MTPDNGTANDSWRTVFVANLVIPSRALAYTRIHRYTKRLSDNNGTLIPDDNLQSTDDAWAMHTTHASPRQICTTRRNVIVSNGDRHLAATETIYGRRESRKKIRIENMNRLYSQGRSRLDVHDRDFIRHALRWQEYCEMHGDVTASNVMT